MKKFYFVCLMTFSFAIMCLLFKHANKSEKSIKPKENTSLNQPFKPTEISRSVLTSNYRKESTLIHSALSPCQPDLGPLAIVTSQKKLASDPLSIKPKMGGLWSPSDCQPLSTIAVLIPYRNRSENLAISTHHLNKFLTKQMISYRIFVIEQLNMTQLFNRASLINVGFLESQKLGNFSCFIIHDMDKLPENTKHLYSCDDRHPRHMIYKIHGNENSKSDYKNGILYSGFFGGVCALTKMQFSSVNGMSNKYWGWGREDDDLHARLRNRKLTVSYTRNLIASYLNLKHAADIVVNKIGWPYKHIVQKEMDVNGLTSIKYSIHGVVLNELYTLIQTVLH